MPVLDHLVFEYARKALAIIRDGLERKPDSRDMELRPIFHVGSVEQRPFFSPSWAALRYLEGELERLPAAEALMDHLTELGIIPVKLAAAPDLTAFDRAAPIYRHAIIDPVVDYLVQTDSFDLQEDFFVTQFRKYERVWSTGEGTSQIFVPLLNLKANFEFSEDLGSRFRWRSLSNDEKGRLWRIARPNEEALTPFALARSDSVLVTSVSTLRILNDERTGYQVSGIDAAESFGAARHLVTALRLVHEGDVGVTTAITYEESASALRSGFHLRVPDLRTPGFDPFQPTRIFELQKSDVPKVRKLFDHLSGLDAGGRLGSLAVALRWFHRSYAREGHEDRVVDLAVALESSLLAGMGDQTELSYRLALRGAALLRATVQPDEMFALLRTAYTVRSKIVHTGRTLEEISKQKQSVLKGRDHMTFAADLREGVRYLLREYIRRLVEDPSHSTIETLNESAERDIRSALADSVPPA